MLPLSKSLVKTIGPTITRRCGQLHALVPSTPTSSVASIARMVHGQSTVVARSDTVGQI